MAIIEWADPKKPLSEAGPQAPSQDIRAKLRAFPTPEAQTYVYGPKGKGLLSCLWDYDGMVFPYTPSIQITQQVNYQSYAPLHANQDFQIYQGTPSFAFSVSGEFTVQNDRERQYGLAVIHFLRSVSKMRFGAQDKERGTPPPMLLFSAYGNLMFNDLPVIVTSYTVEFNNNVDYVQYKSSTPIEGEAWLPAKFNVSVNLTHQKTPDQHRRDFDWESFRNGTLLKRGSTRGDGWW